MPRTRPARRPARWVLALAIPLAAGACSGPTLPESEYPASDPQAAAASPYAAPPPVAAPEQPVGPAVDETADEGAPVDGAKAAAAEALARLDDDPKRLIGLDQAALVDLLGEPRFVRRDEPAQMWRYRDATCVLDLFLYAAPEDRSGPHLVRHVEARGRGEATATARDCLRALLVARLQGRTG